MNDRGVDFVFTCEIGSEYASDSPHGREVIILRGDGAITYENYRGATRREVASTAALPELVKLREHLAKARFPEVPDHPIPPGGSLVELTVREGPEEHKVFMHYHRAEHFEGYRELISMIDTWMAAFRGQD